MKLVLFLVGLAILTLPQISGAEQVLLIYNQGNTLFTSGSGKTISSTTSCADPDVAHVLGKYGMTRGYRIGSDVTNFLDGYYKFVVSSVTAKECVDSLSALSTIQSAVINGTIEPMYGSTREPIDYWYNHTFRWEYGYHHEACDDDSFMVVPHYRQWYLPRGKYDRAWTVTTGDSTNVIAIIDSSFEIGHPDLVDLWAWNQAELGAASQDSVDNDGNGYIDDVLGWDFGSFASDDSLGILNPGDADIGHDQRWWQLAGCNQPWECCCDSTGLDYDENFYNRKRQPWGSNRHGTNMSSIIAARSSDDTTLINPGDPEYLNSGVAGINWKTKLLPVKIGSPAEFIADVPPPQWDAMLKALEYVVIKKNQGLNIIAVNMSLSFDEQGDLTSPVPDVFAQKFWDLRYIHGILPIGGAGNSRIIYENGEPDGVRGYPVYPCRDPSVFCASCVGYHHQIVSYAQYGDEVDGDYDYENVDLCAFGADTGSCGINYDPYGSGTCSDTPFGDIRFPGMMVASSETTHRPGWSVCGTVDSECSPGSFCDQGVYGVAPGDTTTLGDLKHVWGPSAFMTSGTTAQLSGLAGLVAAAFPEFGPDEIEAKIIAAADNIDAANPGITPGDLGAGVTNAWKAVTRWGETPASDLWSGEVWISGDITIPVGAQLIIAAGTTVHIAADDVTAAGSDHTRTEIIVDGTLTCLGTALNPITFDVIADTLTDEWGPIRLRGTGENPVVQLEHCQFQNMSSLMVIDNSAGESTVTISDCTAATSSHGVTLSPLGVNHNLTIQALELTCTTPGTATGIRVLPQAQTNPMVTIGNGTVVDGYFVGMDIDTGDQTTIGDVAINNSLNTGVQLASTGSSLNITGPIEINDTQNTGSIFQGDISSVGNLTVNGTGAVGIFHNTDIATHYQNIELNNCGLWAFYALSPVAGTLVESTVIDSCAVDGLRAAGGGITLGDGVVISNSTQHAVYLDNVNTVIHDVAITNANGAIDIVNGAHAVISDSLIEYCYTAVSALATGTATLSQGGTHFNSITRYYISNFNTTYTINAMSNCYDSSATPSVRKFTGSGPITYLPGYCE